MTVNSLLQNTLIYALGYTLSHHSFLFAILAFCLTRQVPSIPLLLVPSLTLQTLIALGYTIYYTFDYKASLTRYPMLCSLTAPQITCLAFVYAFGYFGPTVYLIQS